MTTNTETVWRYLSSHGPSTPVEISGRTGIGGPQVHNALYNLEMAEMVVRGKGKLWSATPGKMWKDKPKRGGNRPKLPDVDVPRTTQTMHRDGWDFRPLYDAVGMP